MKVSHSNRTESIAEAIQYKHDGYFVARGILERDRVEQVLSEMHQLVFQQLNHLRLPASGQKGGGKLHTDLQTLFTGNLNAYLATLTLCAKLASLYDLYMDNRVRQFVASIGIGLPVFQTAPVMHMMSESLKVPGGYHGLGVHQDWPTLQGGLDTVTLWMPFVDVDRNLFPLELLPGSHLAGLYPYSRSNHIFEVDPGDYDAAKFIHVEAAPGDIVFMSSFTLHRTSTSGDDRLRVATSWRYENGAEPHFVARAYPFAQRRTVVSELITPDFPTVEQVRGAF